MEDSISMGYIRILEKDKNEISTQYIDEMKRLGITERYIFVDKFNGKDSNLEQYQAMITLLREGDVVYLPSIDNLGIHYGEIAKEWSHIVGEKKANIVVMDMPILDTRNDHDLSGTIISDIVIRILRYVAEKEREKIRAKQAEGIALAKLQGAYTGRKPIVVDKEAFESVYAEVVRGDRTSRYAMKMLGLKSNTYYKAVTEYKNKTGRWA